MVVPQKVGFVTSCQGLPNPLYIIAKIPTYARVGFVAKEGWRVCRSFWQIETTREKTLYKLKCVRLELVTKEIRLCVMPSSFLNPFHRYMYEYTNMPVIIF